MIMKKKKVKICNNCDNCVCLGEGDFLCDCNMVIVMEDYCPNENYNYCDGEDWEKME